MSEIFPAPGSGQGISLSVPDDLADKARRLLDSRQDCPGPVDRLNE